MRHATLLLISILCAGAAQAQQVNIEQVGAAGQANLNALGSGAAAPVYLGRTDGMEGSPYLDNRWLQAELTTNNRVPLAPLPLKYDVLHQQLVMRKQGATTDSLRLDDRYLTSFVLLDPGTDVVPARRRVFQRFMDAPNPQHRGYYVEVLHEGKYTLLKQHLKVVQKATARSGYGADVPPAQVVDKSVYFVRRPDAKLIPVKLTMKHLTDAAPEIASALKNGKGTPSNESEWVARLDLADPR